MKRLLLLVAAALLCGCIDIPELDLDLDKPEDRANQIDTFILPSDFFSSLDKDDGDSKEATAKIVVFSSRICFNCPRQKRELDKAEGYAIEHYNIIEDAQLLTKWRLPPTPPVVAIIEDDERVKMFVGFTPWEDIEPHAKNAKLK